MLLLIPAASASYVDTCEEAVEVVSVEATGGNSKVVLRSLGETPCTRRTFERVLRDAVPEVGQKGDARWTFSDGLVAPGVVSRSEDVWLEGLETPAARCELEARVVWRQQAVLVVEDPPNGCPDEAPASLIDETMWVGEPVQVVRSEGVWTVSHRGAPVPGCVVAFERDGVRLAEQRRSVGCLEHTPPPVDVAWQADLPQAFLAAWSEGWSVVE